jgi:hypothetical protein
MIAIIAFYGNLSVNLPDSSFVLILQLLLCYNIHEGAYGGVSFAAKTLPLSKKCNWDFKMNIIKWKLHYMSCNQFWTELNSEIKRVITEFSDRIAHFFMQPIRIKNWTEITNQLLARIQLIDRTWKQIDICKHVPFILLAMTIWTIAIYTAWKQKIKCAFQAA